MSGDIAQLAEMLQRFKMLDADEVPEGWYTAEQVAEKMHVSNTRAKSYLKTGLAKGVIERVKYRVRIGDDLVRSVYHYHVKENCL